MSATVRVWMPGQSKSVRVVLNDTTRPVLRGLSRSTGSYIVRELSAQQALTPFIVAPQAAKN